MNKRKILFLFITIIFLASNYAYSEERYYYGFDTKIPITIIPNKVALYQEDDTTENQVHNYISQHQLTTSWKHNRLCVVENIATISNNAQRSSESPPEDIQQLSVYSIGSELEAILFHEIIVKPYNDDYDMSAIMNQYNLTLKKTGMVSNVYTTPMDSDPISVANAIYETGDFIFAYPHFYFPFKQFAYIPNDTYFQYQITCHNVGQSLPNGHYGSNDADIDAPEAWEITKGSPDIVVAVFDAGVTANHPDLPNSRQIRLSGSNFGSGLSDDPSPQGNNNHGNACAGVIAATMDNNEGIAGIAPNCKIMPIRWDDYSQDYDLAEGIYFAADNGADIISCSWGLNTPNQNVSPDIIWAIGYAIRQGVVVIFAAGNEANHIDGNNGYVCFPANANIENLITVGASDRYDKQAIYSPLSSLIDVVAPSSRAFSRQIETEAAEMFSIDIPGEAGYNPTYEGMDAAVPAGTNLPNFGTNHLAYTGCFSGTSHACPVVAGVVALMLSVNPNLSPSEVYSILTSTCDKVGGYSYIDGKSKELGYGRVNAYAAVMEARIRYIQNKTYYSGDRIVETSPIIKAGYAVTESKPYGDVILNARSYVTYNATEQVVLSHGFHAKVGSNFHVKIIPTDDNVTFSPQHLASRSSSAPTDDTEPTDKVATSNNLDSIENEMIQSTSIYTISGQLLQTIEDGQRDAAHLPNGIYILQHHMSDGSIKSEKIVHIRY